MKQLLHMFTFDFKSTAKSFMGGYMLIVPMVIIIVLKFFLPNMDSTSATIAVVNEGPHAVQQEVIEELRSFASVKTYSNIEDMEQKLRGTGSVEG